MSKLVLVCVVLLGSARVGLWALGMQLPGRSLPSWGRSTEVAGAGKDHGPRAERGSRVDQEEPEVEV